jgi:hypothetical protein
MESRWDSSPQTPPTALDVQKQSGIAQDLQLLANLIFDVAVVGMQLFPTRG